MAMRLAAAAFMRRLAPAHPPIPIPAAAAPAAEAEAVTCGRGDKKTKRGKRFKGSYGNARPKREKKIERIKDRIEGGRHEAIELSWNCFSILSEGTTRSVHVSSVKSSSAGFDKHATRSLHS
ncbi:hypothetical protein PVAP13_2NG446400 [Panicum virgatum]|uniref:30S ribosomal protein S31, mitochondrial n=1 Tax=Panicum virgatum TaxID=38727 RepID=A0A8T0VPJ5_PANVG|nr:hypothetical protein PVAP13_2NG446400 [Panicum virgatum]